MNSMLIKEEVNLWLKNLGISSCLNKTTTNWEKNGKLTDGANTVGTSIDPWWVIWDHKIQESGIIGTT